jgi:lipoate-protein ligase B
MPLEACGLSVQTYIDRLQATIVAVLREFDLSATARAEVLGLFSGTARIATIGIAVSRWIAYHGLTLNVGPYLEMFDLLEEPGIGPGPLRQTSMESRRQRATPMSKVRESFIRNVEETFGLRRHHLFTHHPQIRRKVLTHVYAPSPG